MRFMIVVKATQDSEAGVMPGEDLREESLEWSRRFPNPAGEGKPAEIEVRPFFELEDFASSETIERFREMGTGREEDRA